MYYLNRIIISFRSSLSFFCALLSLSSIVVLSQYGNDILLLSTASSSPISKIVQAAAAISTTTSSYSHSATITALLTESIKILRTGNLVALS